MNYGPKPTDVKYLFRALFSKTQMAIPRSVLDLPLKGLKLDEHREMYGVVESAYRTPETHITLYVIYPSV